MMIKKIVKVVLCILCVAIAAGAATVCIVNSRYEYDPIGVENTLQEGETGVLTVYYNGAEGKPESEEITYQKLANVALPEVSRKGYHFSGWSVNWLFAGNEATLNAKTARARPQFDKDYTAVNAPCAVYTEDFVYTEYACGDYAEVNTEAVDFFLDGGYKATVYSEENFAGEATKVYYSGMFSGFIGSMKIEAVKSEGVAVDTLSDEEKLRLLTAFAPRIWWDEKEEFFAATVECAAENMDKALTPYGYAYYLKELQSPRFMNDYLHGNQAAKAYAFAVEKEFKYLDLTYFVFTPYNKAKVVAGIQFGNHIGDWEHVSVRLMKETRDGKTCYRPVIVDYSAHSFRNYVTWDEVATVDGTHPIAYTARGSHGMWKDGGTHVYVDAKIVKLTDECSEGTAWDLWQGGNMETYAYDALAHRGKGLGNSRWNPVFDTDYCNENGGITRWGNTGWRPRFQIYPQLQSAPGGPQQKKCLNDYYAMSGRKNDI